MIEAMEATDAICAGASLRAAAGESADAPRMSCLVECYSPDGALRWSETIENIVVTVGKTFLLETVFRGAAYSAAWYLGLKGAGTAVVGDTLASHASWTEATPYTGNRPAITWSAASAGSIAGAQVVIPITAAGPVTVAGAFICNAASGTAGTLYNAADFAASRTVYLNDELRVTPTLSFT